MAGHSVAISQVGGAPHYSLGLLEEKFAVDAKTVRVLPLQSNANRIAAVTGGTADTAIIPVTYAMPSIQHGDAKLLGWVGDYTPWQVAAVFASTKATNERSDMLNRFLRASLRGVKDYCDAFIGPAFAHLHTPQQEQARHLFHQACTALSTSATGRSDA